MTYDFESELDRRGWDSFAVEAPACGDPTVPMGSIQVREGFDIIPMWVADMNFPTVPAVPAALARRAAHPAYGYFLPSPAYYQAICYWQQSRNHIVGIARENIGYQNGVLGGLLSALRGLCSVGGPVLLHSPTYTGFTTVIRNSGRKIVLSPLQPDANGIWRMDFDDMEQKIRTQHIHVAVLCSPHNPTGRVWERWELERAMELFRACDVTVISDEIWSDLTLPGYTHIPTQSVSPDARQRTIALYAPSKTFNLAGLTASYHVIYNQRLLDIVDRESQISHYNSMNVLSMHALIAAYSPEGARWLEELRQVLARNIDYGVRFIRSRFDGVKVFRPQASYMLFLDCTDWCRTHQTDLDTLLRAGYSVGVIWEDGRPFHGPYHIRMNVALPQKRIVEAFDRLDRYVFHPSQG